MDCVRCEQGHSWKVDGKDTIAVCPICGGVPLAPKTADTPALQQDQTIGQDSLVRPHSKEEDTTFVVESPPEADEVAASLDRTSAGDDDQPEPGTRADDVSAGEHTIGESPAAPAAADRTLGDAPPPTEQHTKYVDHTIDLGSGAAAPATDSTLHVGDDKPGTFQANVADDKTGVWGPSASGGSPGRDADRTVPIGDLAHAPAKPPRNTVKPHGGVKRKKDPLDGKTSVAGYQILGELGRGGMGVVYKAREPGANRIVALKMVLNSAHVGRETMVRFKIEAEAIALLQHPNIVQLYEVGEEDGCPFFSLEFVEGDSLSKKIENTPQLPRDAARMVQLLAEAMHTAHQRGIIHRDLKPANILLTRDGVPKITDFGLAKRFEDKGEGQTRTGAIMGTPSYMAPEQAQGRTKETGPAADVYSLGAILYDMLTGRPPFRGSTLLETLQQVQTLEPVAPKRLQPSLEPDLQTICLKALEKNPIKRYLTAGALAEDLRRFQAGEPILARPTRWTERTWKWAKRRPAVASLVTLSVLGVISLLTLGGFWLDSERRAAETKRQAAVDNAARQMELTRAAEQMADLERKRAAEQTAARDKEVVLRQAAERNFKRAKLAVDQMLSEVGQDRLRYIPLMEPVRRDLLKKAKAFYDDFMQERSSDPDIRREAALAQQRVADILELLGDSATALGAYQTALELLQRLDQDYPNKLDYKKDLASVANNFGNLLKDLKHSQDAENIYRRALDLRQALHDRDPQAAESALELAKSHNNLAQILYGMGQGKEAEVEFEASRLILSKLAHSPGDAQYKAELARTLNNLGTFQATMGPPGTAEKAYAEANKLLNELAANEPRNATHRQELAKNYFLQGRLARDASPKEAEEHYRQSIKLRRAGQGLFEHARVSARAL